MVLEEQPAKVAEAVKLFLQGLGYTTVRSTRLRSASLANTPIKKRLIPTTTRTTTNLPSSPANPVNPQTAELITGLQGLVLQQQNAS
jgi:hypothetical protein